MKTLLLFAILCILCVPLSAAEKPNILVILADDLGYGDVQCYNPERGRIPTPHIDGLARQGMRFTDAHTSSGVCSPTRYSLLTGRYHWRTRLQSGIVNAWEKPLIAADRLTIAGLLQQQGYRTAAIGKWHLGWDWPLSDEERQQVKGLGGKAGGGGVVRTTVTEAQRASWQNVFAMPIGGGPTTRGFDSYFGTDVPNWPPYCFIENERTVGIPDELLPAKALAAGQASLQGPAVKDWKLEDILPALGDRACAFITESAKQTQPFFLYMPLTAPHTPIAVNKEWQGKSGLNRYADFVMETDAVVGRVLAALNESGAAKNTLVIFTSDNGCAPPANIAELQAKGHFPSGPWRGHKADVWEGGHRVPFIVRWPGVVREDSQCDALIQQTDLMSTFAEILALKSLPPQSGEDSVSLLPLLRGSDQPVREHAICCSMKGLPSLRMGSWKIIFGEGGAGFAGGKDPLAETGQLYDLATDPGEVKNLWAENPELVAEMMATMQRLVGSHKNDVPVQWRRFLKTAARIDKVDGPKPRQ